MSLRGTSVTGQLAGCTYISVGGIRLSEEAGVALSQTVIIDPDWKGRETTFRAHIYMRLTLETSFVTRLAGCG